MNKVEIISDGRLRGPYTVKINGQTVNNILDIDLNGMVSSDEGKHITLSILVEELVIRPEYK